MSDVIKENFNFMQNTSGIVATMGLESLGKSAAGNLVTPRSRCWNLCGWFFKCSSFNCNEYF